MTPCPTCQTHNREVARFCRSCGSWLLPHCPFCNAGIVIPSFHCDQCGRVLNSEASRQPGTMPAAHPLARPVEVQQGQQPDTLAASQAQLQSLIPAAMSAKLSAARQQRAMEGQRRVVTILFCDIKGSTEAASQFDPEEWAGIINDAFECMIPPVYHYEGTVARLMGDGILAFFGAPIAHEDDPKRAVLAGLEILAKTATLKAQVLARWGIEIDARVGINTGLVVVGAVGSDMQMEYTALGDAINIAARMEQTAQPGSVQISEETHRQVAPYFEFEDLGQIQVKGKEEPVHTYRPLRSKADPGRLRGIQGLETLTIGREEEMAALQSALNNLSSRGVGGLIFLTGDAGIGKSRLIRELRAPEQSSGVVFHEISPQSFETSQPYAFFRAFLRQLTGIGEVTTAEEAAPILAALAEQLPIEVRGGVAGAVASVLGVSEAGDAQTADGESFKRQLFATVREVVHAHFMGQPGVIMLDDLHWADPASLEIFNHLFRLVETAPILFLCAIRPERDAPVWAVKTALAEEYPHRFTEITLQPLSADDSQALVQQLLSAAELPANLRQLILEKSEGNPFFLEEIVRTLIEDGVLVQPGGESTNGQTPWQVSGEVGAIHIPDSLQTLLAARLDRLTEQTRQVLQMASVIGRTFYYRVLENVGEAMAGLDNSLSMLQRINMVVETARLPELEYAFRHALLQETTYRSILRQQRREFHQQVGEAMEALFAVRLDEYAPILAMHFDRAGDAARAFRYFLLAGDVSFRLHAVKEAISHYSSALALAKGERFDLETMTPDMRRHLCLRLGRAFEMDGRYEEALTHYAEVEERAREQGDRQLELAALVARATIHSAPTHKHDAKLAESMSQKALALAQELGNHETEAKIYWNLMNMSIFSAESEIGYEHGSRSLEIARRYDLKEQLAYTLNDFQRANMMTGNIKDAERFVKEAQQLWQDLGNQAMYIDSLVSGSMLATIQNHNVQAEKECLEALRLSQEIGNLWGQSYAYYTLGFLYTHQSRFAEALEVTQNALRLVEPSGFVVPLVDCNTYTAWIYGYLGDYEQGKSFALAALQHAKERLPAMQVGPASILAILEYWQGNTEEMDEWLMAIDLSVMVTSYTSFERFLAECYRSYAASEHEQVVRQTEEMLPYIQSYGKLAPLGPIHCVNGMSLLALNRLDEARDWLNQAQALSSDTPHEKIDNLVAFSRLESLLGNDEAAKARLVEAWENVEIVLKSVDDPVLRASYLARPPIKAILDEAGELAAPL